MKKSILHLFNFCRYFPICLKIIFIVRVCLNYYLRHGLFHIAIIILCITNQVKSQDIVVSSIHDAINELHIDFSTPAFKKTTGFTNYEELIVFLNQEINIRSDIAKIEWIGESGSGKKIPAIMFEQKNNNKKIKVWMQGGLHGNEPASSESMLILIQYLVNNPEIDSLFERITLMIVPIANIDGYEKQSRYAENRVDLNRDQTILNASETVHLKTAFNNFSPQVAADFHEYRPIRSELKKISDDNLSIPYDVLFLPSGNLNIPCQLRNQVDQLFIPKLEENLRKYGLSSNYYFLPWINKTDELYLKMGGSSPRSSATSFGLTNAISILFEIKGIGLDRKLFERRVFSGFTLAKTLLYTSYNNFNDVNNAINIATESTICLKNDIVLEAQPKEYEGEIQLINSEIDSIFKLNLNILDANQSVATKTRARPEGYILLPEYSEFIYKLKVLGLEIDTLLHDTLMLVEEYKITELDKSQSLTDKLQKVKISTELVRKEILIPSGSFIITTRQKNANIAVSMLEPEMANGAISYGIIDVNIETGIPIYRVLNRLNIL